MWDSWHWGVTEWDTEGVMEREGLSLLTWCEFDLGGELRFLLGKREKVLERQWIGRTSIPNELVEHLPVPESVICSVLSNSLWPHGLEPTRLLCPWDFPGKNTGVSIHSLLHAGLPDPGIKPGSPTLQADSLPSEPPGSIYSTRNKMPTLSSCPSWQSMGQSSWKLTPGAQHWSGGDGERQEDLALEVLVLKLLQLWCFIGN